jgi:hypothetical protein
MGHAHEQFGALHYQFGALHYHCRVLVLIVVLGTPFVFPIALAGIVATAAGGPLVEWLGLNEKAVPFAQLGCFFVALIAFGWTYVKLRNWRPESDGGGRAIHEHSAKG